MANPFSHEQRFSVWLVDNATGKIVQQRATSHSAWMTMTTLLSGENFAAWAGGFIQTAATGPSYVEPDLTGATAWNAWDAYNKLILGFDYFGPGGVIYFTDYDDNLTFCTVKDSLTYGVQSKACQAKTIFQQGAGGAPSTAFTDTGLGGDTHFIGIYMTKVIKS